MALAVAQNLAAADSSNTLWQRDLLVAYKELGEIAVKTGKLEDARGWFNKTLAVAQTLAVPNSNDIQWQREFCVTLAANALVARDSTKVTRQLGEARSIYGRLQHGSFFRYGKQIHTARHDLGSTSSQLHSCKTRTIRRTFNEVDITSLPRSVRIRILHFLCLGQERRITVLVTKNRVAITASTGIKQTPCRFTRNAMSPLRYDLTNIPVTNIPKGKGSRE